MYISMCKLVCVLRLGISFQKISSACLVNFSLAQTYSNDVIKQISGFIEGSLYDETDEEEEDGCCCCCFVSEIDSNQDRSPKAEAGSLHLPQALIFVNEIKEKEIRNKKKKNVKINVTKYIEYIE